MNVALISNEYLPFNNAGGIATFMTELAKLLTKLGHQVIVFTDGGESLNRSITSNGITIIPFLNKRSNALIRTLVAFFPNKLMITILQRYAPDLAKLLRCNLLALLTFVSYRKHATMRVIHTPVQFAPVYLISLIFPSITIVTHAQGPDELLQPYDRVTKDSMLKAQIETLYMKHSKFIIPCSQTVNDYLKEKYQSIRKKLIYIQNFIDTKSFPTTKKSLNTNTLLFVGRMEYRKGPDLVVKAFVKLFRKYPNLKLILLGEDTTSWFVNGKPVSFLNYVRSLRLSTRIQRQITFTPRIDDRSHLLKYLSAHRGIAVLPSRYEPFGFVFIEAMMAGCITMASAYGGGAEIIENGVDGFTVEPKVKDIVSCIQKIKSLHPRSCEALTYRARQKITATYDISRVTNAYEALYDRIEKDLH